MSKFPLFVVLFLLFGVMLSAEEFALRQATDVRWAGLHVRTADNCEIVFWSDAIQGDMDVYAQKINPSGVAVWNEALPMVLKPGDQDIMDVVKTSDNNFIIIWREYEIDETLGFWVQKITSNGQRLWAENGVELFDGGQVMRNAILVANNAGGAFVVFQYGYGANSVMGQNLDALGNQLWQAGGIQLVSFSSYINLEQALSDGAGGVILNYSNYQNSQNINHLLRISDSGNVVGNDPLMPVSAFPGYQYKIMPGSNGQYILYYVYNDINPFVRLAKIDNQGNLLLPETVDYPLSTYDVTQNVALANSSDGGVAVAWKSSTEAGEIRWRVQRLSGTFAPLWPEPGVQFGSSSFDGGDIALSVGANDNIWIAWDNTNNEGTVQTVKAQMVSAAGVTAWTAEGMTLSADNGNPLVMAYADRAMFVWSPDLEGKTSVRRQVISSGGALFLAENGEPMVQRIFGQAYLGDVIAFHEKYLTIWSDERGTGQIFYQLNNQNMEPLLEENGRALNDPSWPAWAWIASTCLVDENKVAVLYFVYDNHIFTYYLQLIDGNGAKLLPGNGVVFPGYTGYGEIAIGSLNSDIYVIWEATQDDYNYQIKGQRIVNGQKMWGDDGRIITHFTPGVLPCTIKVHGRYIIWTTENDNLNQYQTFALLVNENGDPALGWEAAGLRIINEANSVMEGISHSGLADNDLIVFVNQYDGAYPDVRGQRINNNAERLWGEGGVALGFPGQSNWIDDAVYDDGITCLIQTQVDGLEQIRIQKLSVEGELLWEESGNLVADNLHNCYDAQLGKFANGSYFCVYTDNDGAWIQNRDVFIRYITPQGVPQGEAPSVFCGARYQQDHVKAAVLGNQALVAWSDDRAGIISSEVAMTGVWGNRIISDYVAADDPLDTPPALLSIEGNYPNPFNPSTTISFELGVSGSTEVSIYNLKGQLVRTLLSTTDLLAGKHKLVWNGTDDNGKTVSSGIYLCRVSSAGSSATRKMVMAK